MTMRFAYYVPRCHSDESQNLPKQCEDRFRIISGMTMGFAYTSSLIDYVVILTKACPDESQDQNLPKQGESNERKIGSFGSLVSLNCEK